MPIPPHLFRAAAAAALLLTAACSGGGGGTEVQDRAPVITITGVAEGGEYAGPVTLGISVDRGSYTATLNGTNVASGEVVSAPNDYELQVTARSGTATSNQTVRFKLRFAGTSLLIIRLLDLGDNGPGGGDAILLTDSTAAGMRHALVDAGPGGSGGDANDPEYVRRRLAQLGVTRLDFVQLTHAHSDHFGGLSAVVNAIPTDRFVYNGQVRNLSSYNSAVNAARNRASATLVPTDTVKPAFGYQPGTVVFVHPLSTYLASDPNDGGPINEGSIGTAIRRGTFQMFLTGDGEVEANQRWRTQFASLTRDLEVLKVGHHGANNAIFDNGFSGASTWLQHTSPEVMVISANGSSHPRINALNAMLGRPQTETYCTSVHGEITIRVADSGQYTVTPQRNAPLDCVAGSDATT